MKIPVPILSFCLLAGATPLALAQGLTPATIPVSAPNSPLKTARTLDFVINDDLIVTQSGCIGFDCADGIVFGFSTLLLKENNLRIRFEDTSNSASFPSDDWELQANETPNGGAEQFAIANISQSRVPFKVMGDARTNSIVANGSLVGFGTANPVTSLHTVFGNTPTLRLEQDGSQGWASQTWDVAGNETNFFIRDVTNSSQLPFRIRPGAPSNSIFIKDNGNVGLGTSDPKAKLHVDGKAVITDTLFAQNNISLSVATPSDRKLKTNIQDIPDAAVMLSRLQPKSYFYDTATYPLLNFSSDKQYGLIAQEVEQVLPGLVNQVSHPNGMTFKSLNYTGLIPLMLQELNEHQLTIARLQEEVNSLRRQLLQVETLSNRLRQLEASLNSMEKGAREATSLSGK